METVKHLWNINQFMAKLKNPLTAELQMCYTKKCQNLSRIVELPKQNFGPSVACSHCGSLWNIVDHQVRILHGKKMSKSIRKIVQCMNENDEKIPKVRASLARKAIKNEMNKLIIKCSQCSNKTEVPFKKKPRLKPSKLNDSEINIEENNSKKKKKKRRSRNKYAGLNMSFCTSELKKNDETSTEVTTPKAAVTTPKIAVTTPKIAVTTPKVAITTPKVAVTTPKVAVTTPKISATPKRNKTPNITSPKKSKKLNVQRLKQIVKQNMTKSKTKKNSLHNFLTELSK